MYCMVVEEILMTQLLLGGLGVAGLLHVVDTHGMAGGMGSASLHAGIEADVVPDHVDEGW